MVEPVALWRGQLHVFRQLEPEEVVQVVGGDAVGVEEHDPIELGQEEDVEFLVAAAVVEVGDVRFQAWKSPENLSRFFACIKIFLKKLAADILNYHKSWWQFLFLPF